MGRFFFGDLVNLARIGHPVDEHDAIQVVDLVLENARQIIVGLDALRLTVGILAAHDDLGVPLHLAQIAGNRETALLPLLLVPRGFDNLGIHEGKQFGREALFLIGGQLDHDHAVGNVDLRRSQAHARRRAHCFDHVVNQLLELGAEFGDLACFLPEGRMSQRDDFPGCHVFT